MPTLVECPSCRARLVLRSGRAGRLIECPGCGGQVVFAPPAAPGADADVPGDGVPPPSLLPLAAAALFCGAVAFCLASFADLSLATKPLAALGLALGVAAWLRGRGEAAGVLLPSAVAVCLLVTLFAGSWQDWKRVLTRPSAAARSRTLLVPAANQGMEAFARVAADDWVDVAQGAVQQNGIRVRVSSVALGSPRVKVSGKEQRQPARRLLVGVRLTGENLVRLANYESWADPAREAARHEPRLTDDRGRAYRRVSFGARAELVGCPGDTFLTPGKPVNDLLVFEAPPVNDIQYLRLELPASAFGGAGTLRFQVPKSAIKTTEPARGSLP